MRIKRRIILTHLQSQMNKLITIQPTIKFMKAKLLWSKMSKKNKKRTLNLKNKKRKLNKVCGVSSKKVFTTNNQELKIVSFSLQISVENAKFPHSAKTNKTLESCWKTSIRAP